jgi:hypothetical protein
LFDRFLLWEAVVRSPEEVFKHVPKQDFDKYQYYNIPVSADTGDASSPVNVLKVGVGEDRAVHEVGQIALARAADRHRLSAASRPGAASCHQTYTAFVGPCTASNMQQQQQQQQQQQ